jgi:hypothetical protein
MPVAAAAANTFAGELGMTTKSQIFWFAKDCDTHTQQFPPSLVRSTPLVVAA